MMNLKIKAECDVEELVLKQKLILLNHVYLVSLTVGKVCVYFREVTSSNSFICIHDILWILSLGRWPQQETLHQCFFSHKVLVFSLPPYSHIPLIFLQVTLLALGHTRRHGDYKRPVS